MSPGSDAAAVRREPHGRPTATFDEVDIRAVIATRRRRLPDVTRADRAYVRDAAARGPTAC